MPLSVNAEPNKLSSKPMQTNCTTVIKKTPIEDLHHISNDLEFSFVRPVQQKGASILYKAISMTRLAIWIATKNNRKIVIIDKTMSIKKLREYT